MLDDVEGDDLGFIAVIVSRTARGRVRARGDPEAAALEEAWRLAERSGDLQRPAGRRSPDAPSWPGSGSVPDDVIADLLDVTGQARSSGVRHAIGVARVLGRGRA